MTIGGIEESFNILSAALMNLFSLNKIIFGLRIHPSIKTKDFLEAVKLIKPTAIIGVSIVGLSERPGGNSLRMTTMPLVLFAFLFLN